METKLALSETEMSRPNSASAFAPPPVNVTFHNFHNVYVYSGFKLWISYGVAIALSAIAAVIGLIGLAFNGASYSHNFSTVLRVARGASMSQSIKEQDLDGKDPLPSYLSKAVIWLNGQVAQQDQSRNQFELLNTRGTKAVDDRDFLLQETHGEDFPAGRDHMTSNRIDQ